MATPTQATPTPCKCSKCGQFGSYDTLCRCGGSFRGNSVGFVERHPGLITEKLERMRLVFDVQAFNAKVFSLVDPRTRKVPKCYWDELMREVTAIGFNGICRHLKCLSSLAWYGTASPPLVTRGDKLADPQYGCLACGFIREYSKGAPFYREPTTWYKTPVSYCDRRCGKLGSPGCCCICGGRYK